MKEPEQDFKQWKTYSRKVALNNFLVKCLGIIEKNKDDLLPICFMTRLLHICELGADEIWNKEDHPKTRWDVSELEKYANQFWKDYFCQYKEGERDGFERA